MATKEYIIDTEDINRPEIQQALEDCGVTGYTIIEHDGCYSKHTEKSISIVVIADGIKYLKDKLRRVCEIIKRINKQDAVYLETRDIELTIV